MIGLLRALDLSRPELASAGAAWARGDLSGACEQVLEHYGSVRLPDVLFYENGSLEAHESAARLALRDEFSLQGVVGRQPRRADGGLDWRARGPRGDPEWAWFLNRHDHFRSLLRRWQTRRDEACREQIESQLLDWIRTQRRPHGVSFSPAWRPLEAARRVAVTWLELFYTCEPEPVLSPDARLLMLSSIPEHGHALRWWHSWFGNHLVSEMVALITMALAWPEFRLAQSWQAYASRRAFRALETQIYPDGAYTGLSSHYQGVVLNELRRLYGLLEHAGDEVGSASARDRLETMYEYLAGVIRPDGQGPHNNDGDLRSNRPALRSGEQLFDRTDWTYLHSGGRIGTPPAAPASRYFPWSGQAIMRNGWHPDAHWARFDMGPHGTEHQHHDQLNIELMANGRMLLTDPGRFSYVPDKMRAYFLGPEGHNVVRIDGAGSRPPPDRVRIPLHATAIVDSAYDFFAQSATFASPAWSSRGKRRWTRSVLYLRDDYWLVFDFVEAYGPAEVAASWNFHPDCSVVIDKGMVRTVDPSVGNLAVIPSVSHEWAVSAYHGQTRPRALGWYSATYNQRQPSTMVEYITQIRSPRIFAWALVPLSANDGGSHLPMLQPRTSTPGGYLLEVQWPHRQGTDRVALRLRPRARVMLDERRQLDGPCAVLRTQPGEPATVLGSVVERD